MLSEETPAWYVAFDLLEDSNGVHMDKPFAERRVRLEAAAEGWEPPFFITPATADVDEARAWFETFEGAGMDGVMAKPVLEPYAPGKRALTKVKHQRTADCVVAGYREHTSGPVVGSLLLGLYDDEGRLHHVGVCSAFTAARRAELVDELTPYVTSLDEHPWNPETAEAAGIRRPGTVNRWNAKKNLGFVPLRPERVVEVAYDQIQGDYRFRHNPRFARWRPDRTPDSCRFDQLDRPVSYDVGEVLRRGRPG
jgi:ATP-dependent DNA ligase